MATSFGSGELLQWCNTVALNATLERPLCYVNHLGTTDERKKIFAGVINKALDCVPTHP
jgi:hypothetical protein